MFLKFLCSIIILIPPGSHCYSQVTTDLSYEIKKPSWKRAVMAPSILLATGILATTDNEVFDKWEVQEERNEYLPHFRTHSDDYLQYSPIAVVFGLNVMGIHGEHDLPNLTALFIKSELIMTALVFPLKKLTAVPRPTGEPTSFPSGHTAQAFVAATIMHKEYGKDHPMYSVLAFTTASGIGILRVMNNRHWVSDVLAGAGIGIFATNLAYLTHHGNWGKKYPRLAGSWIMPTYNQKALGVSLLLPIRSQQKMFSHR